MLAPVTHIESLTTIRRERLLPTPGKVLARKGQKVYATDTIAEANVNPLHILLNVSRALGVRPEDVDEYMGVEAGSKVEEGDVLAGPVGLFRRVVRAPKNGVVLVASGGEILLDVQKLPFELKAGMSGVVTELIADRGAIIETVGALVQCAWGNGRLDEGLLHVLADAPEHTLSPDLLDVSFRGSVVLAGFVDQAETLQAAAELPLKGLILSGMSPELVEMAQNLHIPIVLVEGFGRKPMNTAAFNLLSSSDRRRTSVNAEPWDRFRGSRPEVVMPLPATGNPGMFPDTDVFAAGKKVRILWPPHAGEVGTLVEVKKSAKLENGLRAPSGEVRLESGQTVNVPLSNMEILGQGANVHQED